MFRSLCRSLFLCVVLLAESALADTESLFQRLRSYHQFVSWPEAKGGLSEKASWEIRFSTKAQSQMGVLSFRRPQVEGAPVHAEFAYFIEAASHPRSPAINLRLVSLYAPSSGHMAIDRGPIQYGIWSEEGGTVHWHVERDGELESNHQFILGPLGTIRGVGIQEESPKTEKTGDSLAAPTEPEHRLRTSASEFEFLELWDFLQPRGSEAVLHTEPKSKYEICVYAVIGQQTKKIIAEEAVTKSGRVEVGLHLVQDFTIRSDRVQVDPEKLMLVLDLKNGRSYRDFPHFPQYNPDVCHIKELTPTDEERCFLVMYQSSDMSPRDFEGAEKLSLFTKVDSVYATLRLVE